MRTWAAAGAMVLAGSVAAWTLTDGLQAFTLETARRLAVERAPRALPLAAGIETAEARVTTLGNVLAGAIVVVDFVYTDCPTVCQALGGTFGALQRELTDEIARGEVRLLTIGFDRERDTPAALQAYLVRHGAGPGWAAARARDSAANAELLRAFGIVAIDDGFGGYVHNAALHLVDATGRLRRIDDPTDWRASAIAARALAAMSPPPSHVALAR